MYLKQLAIKGRKYWYLFHTIRKGNKFLKKSRYLGAELPSPEELEKIKAEWQHEIFPVEHRQIRNVFVIYMEPSSDVEVSTLKHTTALLDKYSFTYAISERSKVAGIPENTQLVIVVGGDGTFLCAAHYVKEEYMLGVNSNPAQKEGFLMPFTKETLTDITKKIAKNKFNYISLVRLESNINNFIRPELALNEIFIGHKKPYKISRLILNVHSRKEMLKSSGIVIGTPAGYSAWLKSMGGKPMKLTAKNYQYVIREPYEGRLHKHYKKQEILNLYDTLTISSLTHDAVVVIDSLSKEYFFPLRSTIKISISKYPLKYIVKR